MSKMPARPKDISTVDGAKVAAPYRIVRNTGLIIPNHQFLEGREDLVPFWGPLPPIGKDGSRRYVEEDKGPEFAHEETPEPTKEEEEKSLSYPVSADVISLIMEAIPNLKVVDYTAAGIPKIDALESLLNHKITAAERNEAWGMYMEMKSLEG